MRKVYVEGNECICIIILLFIIVGFKFVCCFKKREYYDDNWFFQFFVLFKFLYFVVLMFYIRVNGFGVVELFLRFFCLCGQVVDQMGFEEVVYEFFVQVFMVYEEVVSDLKVQFQVVCVIVSVLYRMRNFGKENYDMLIMKCVQYVSKLLRKLDQCRVVYLVSYLWWVMFGVGEEEEGGGDVSFFGIFDDVGCVDEKLKFYCDGKRVFECLQWVLRVVDSCMEIVMSIELFVEILDCYVYYFDQKNELVCCFFFVVYFLVGIDIGGRL